jgi:bifunctional polynucleotide phosphatase/kinase
MPADLAALTNGKSVVIDNTNPESATRKRYIDLAKKSKKAVRCVWVSTPRELAQHLNLVRHIAGTSENPIGNKNVTQACAR